MSAESTSKRMKWTAFKPRSRKNRITREVWGDLDDLKALAQELNMRPSTIRITIHNLDSDRTVIEILEPRPNVR